MASFLGDRVEVDVDCGDGTSLRGRLPAGLNPPPAGSAVVVTIDPTDVVLLPRPSQRTAEATTAGATTAAATTGNTRTDQPTETLR